MERVVVPGYPHHIVLRGVRSMDIFFEKQDRTEYLAFLRQQGDRFGVKFLSCGLMSNHVHLLVVPKHPDSLARAIGEADRPFDPDTFYAIVEKLTGVDARPGNPSRPARKQQYIPGLLATKDQQMCEPEWYKL